MYSHLAICRVNSLAEQEAVLLFHQWIFAVAVGSWGGFQRVVSGG